jgi:2-polyprenyl-6-methoxyphenol hydroxylase-like FAD-dependent oxidoreductase
MAHVVIAGAGPGGAALAFLLARRGIQVSLLERHRNFAREFRGEVLLPGGLDALAQMGLWDELRAVPHVKLEALHLYILGKRRVQAGFDPSVFGELSPRWMSQPGLLELLVARASRQPTFRLLRGATVRDLVHEGGRCVGVRALTGDGEAEIRGDFVVGADGRTSVVRRRAGLPTEEDPTPMDVLWCKLPLPASLEACPSLSAYLGNGHLLIAAPVYDRKLQIAWIIRKGSFGEIKERGMPACLEEMARHVGPDLAAHLRAHKYAAIEPFLLWTIADRVTTWTMPGLLVIGDAAHTMSPVGAQGVNIALRDAIVAANHLVPVLTENAAPDAIDAAARRVEQERVPEVSAIQRMQAQPPRVILSNAWWARLALAMLPVFIRGDLGRGRRGVLFNRFAFGVTAVRLRV